MSSKRTKMNLPRVFVVVLLTTLMLMISRQPYVLVMAACAGGGQGELLSIGAASQFMAMQMNRRRRQHMSSSSSSSSSVAVNVKRSSSSNKAWFDSDWVSASSATQTIPATTQTSSIGQQQQEDSQQQQEDSSSSSSPRRRRRSFGFRSPSPVVTMTAARTTTTAVPPPQRGGSIKTMSAAQMEFFRIFSGGMAGTVASCVTNPLEVIKTQLQSSNTLGTGRGHPVAIAQRILQREGVSGFFRGLAPTLIGIIPSRSAYFYAYQKSKHALDPVLPAGSPANALLAGFLAGIVGNTLTNPIWMVRTRMQLLADASAGQRNYHGYRDAITTIFQQEGVGGFYKGIQASYWGCIEGSMQFLVYEQLKTRLLARRHHQRALQGLPPLSAHDSEHELDKATIFWIAAVAKMVASIATYPHEVARTRMREQARAGLFKYQGMWQTLAVIAKEEGRAGLYGGMGIHLIKVVPNSALMFLTYEIVRSWLGGFTVTDDDDETEDDRRKLAQAAERKKFNRASVKTTTRGSV